MKDENKCFVNLNYECNSNCIACVMENHQQSYANPSFEKIKSKIDDILKNFDHIEFNGGEPLLNKNLFKILKYVDFIKKNTEIGILSNCRLFTYERNVEKLILLKLKNLKIITTIYGHNSLIHNAITRTPKSFEQQIIGIKNLIKNNVRLEIRIVVHKMNYKYLNEITQYISDNFISSDFNSVNIINAKLTGQAIKNLNMVGVKMQKIAPFLKSSVEKLMMKKFKVKLSHFPHCILPKELWAFSSGLAAEKTEVVFSDKCNICLMKEVCSGVWASYAKCFGLDELNSIEYTC